VIVAQLPVQLVVPFGHLSTLFRLCVQLRLKTVFLGLEGGQFIGELFFLDLFVVSGWRKVWVDFSFMAIFIFIYRNIYPISKRVFFLSI
jgi:hypothetical protein